MFRKKSNVTNQLRLKEELLKELNLVLYKLEKGQYNKSLDETQMNSLFKDIRVSYHRLENSFGDGETDISIGCNKVKNDLKNLVKASNGILLGRFEDTVVDLLVDIDEIIDLEAGIISEISKVSDLASRKQRTLDTKLKELSIIEQEFNNHSNRVEDEISKLEKDKNELDKKLLSESNPRIKQNIFKQIQSVMKQIQTLQVKSSQYSSCFNLLNSINIYAKELIAAGNLSNVELDKAKIILNLNRLRFVLDDPSKLKPLLKTIETDLKKSQAHVNVINNEINKAFDLGEESFEAMNAYQNDLIKNQNLKDDISSGVSDLEDYLKKIEKKE